MALFFVCLFYFIFLFKKGKKTRSNELPLNAFEKNIHLRDKKYKKKMAESKILIGRKLIFKPVLYHFWKLMS